VAEMRGLCVIGREEKEERKKKAKEKKEKTISV
jgi:hypothetical protein